jgi:hypothetical protein
MISFQLPGDFKPFVLFLTRDHDFVDDLNQASMSPDIHVIHEHLPLCRSWSSRQGGYCLVMSSICHGATEEAVYNNILISTALRRTLIA